MTDEAAPDQPKVDVRGRTSDSIGSIGLSLKQKQKELKEFWKIEAFI